MVEKSAKAPLSADKAFSFRLKLLRMDLCFSRDGVPFKLDFV
jgi:hypothetical protein